MARRPGKNVNYPRAPGIAVAVSTAPYYPCDSQLQVYVHLHHKKGTFGCPRSGREHLDLDSSRKSPSIMEQMIASWSMVMVHGLMVAGHVCVSPN